LFIYITGGQRAWFWSRFQGAVYSLQC